MPENSAKVSIVIPVYNSGKYLKRCLDSAVNQTLKDIEIIIINDGSTDNSEKIIEKYLSDKRIKYISQNNQGQSTARNKGIDAATGEYIGFMDSDDWVDLDFFEKLYTAAQKNNADISVGDIIRIHRFGKKPHIKYTEEISTANTNEKFSVCDVPEKSYVVNKLYKLDKLKSLNIKFEEGRIFEDCVFTPEVLLKLDNLITVPNANYWYWRHNDSTVTKRDEKSNEDSVYMHQKAENFMKENNIEIINYKQKRIKLFGITILKIKEKDNNTEYRLFNFIKWNKTKHD